MELFLLPSFHLHNSSVNNKFYFQLQNKSVCFLPSVTLDLNCSEWRYGGRWVNMYSWFRMRRGRCWTCSLVRGCLKTKHKTSTWVYSKKAREQHSFILSNISHCYIKNPSVQITTVYLMRWTTLHNVNITTIIIMLWSALVSLLAEMHVEFLIRGFGVILCNPTFILVLMMVCLIV